MYLFGTHFELSTENIPQESDCENETNGNAAQETAQNAANKGGDPNMSRFKNESVVALCVGFVLFITLFAFLCWLEGIFEKAHVSSAVIFCSIFVIFILGIAGIAWLIIEWVGYPKSVISASGLGAVLFLLFLISHKSVYIEEPDNPLPQPFPIQANQVVFDEMKSYPGFSIHLLLNLGEQVEGRDNFILDTGMADDRDRISVYTDPDKNLCFKVIGDNGQPVILQASPSIETFQYGSKLWLGCDYGMTNDFCFMRMFINGNEVAENLKANPMASPLQWLTFNPVLASNAEGIATNHLIIGNDIHSRNSGSGVFSWTIFATNTTDRNTLDSLAKMFTGISVTQPNFVEGTYVATDELKTLFPYGYAVIYYSANKQVTYQIFTNALSDWDINWEKFKFGPDFSRGKILVRLTVNSAKFSNQNAHFYFDDVGLAGYFPLIAGCGGSMLPWKHVNNGTPVPYFVTLNDERTNLVFAIGFKIQSPDNAKAK